MNGTSVVEKQIGDTIKHIEDQKPKSDHDRVVAEGTTLALRLGEAALKATTKNRYLLYLIIAVELLKPEDMDVWKAIAKILVG